MLYYNLRQVKMPKKSVKKEDLKIIAVLLLLVYLAGKLVSFLVPFLLPYMRIVLHILFLCFVIVMIIAYR